MGRRTEQDLSAVVALALLCIVAPWDTPGFHFGVLLCFVFVDALAGMARMWLWGLEGERQTVMGTHCRMVGTQALAVSSLG